MSSLSRLQRLRERLAIILIALLPFHALLITVLTKLFAGPNHSPLAALSLWKEILLAIMLAVAIAEWFRSNDEKKWRLDRIDMLFIAFMVIALAVSALHPQLRSAIYGIKYDFIAPIAFLILRRVEWSEAFRVKLKTTFFLVAGIVAGYGLLTLLLPSAFFRLLGYSDLHSLYVPSLPIAAFQQIEGIGIQRLQSTFSGPNQLGLWLLLPWSFAVIDLLSTDNLATAGRKIAFLILLALSILLAFSRSAWIAAALIGLLAVSLTAPAWLVRRLWMAVGGCIVVLAIGLYVFRPGIITRAASTSDHFKRPLAALSVIAQHPLGLGLGTAGPASNAVSDACVFLRPEDDPSWAKSHPELCVFVGEQKVQPPDRDCHCPLLPENWYLQIGIETGVIGLALYLAFLFCVLLQLKRQSSPLGRASFLALFGICIAGLFLHSFEDSAIAFSIWLLTAATVSPRSATEA